MINVNLTQRQAAGRLRTVALDRRVMCDHERKEMNKIQHATFRLAQACDGSPVPSTLVVMLFFVMFSFVEAGVEIALFGKRFEHALDAVFALAFMAYSAYAVYWCAVFNSTKNKTHNA